MSELIDKLMGKSITESISDDISTSGDNRMYVAPARLGACRNPGLTGAWQRDYCWHGLPTVHVLGFTRAGDRIEVNCPGSHVFEAQERSQAVARGHAEGSW